MKLINCNSAQEILYNVTKLDNINLIQSNFSVTLHDIVRNNYNIDLYEGEVLKIIKKSLGKRFLDNCLYALSWTDKLPPIFMRIT